jgi:CheY-like chemotaxis protein
MNIESNLAGGKPLILIVEDSLPQCVFLRRTLEKAGYEVAAATNGVEALDLLAHHAPALIISDVMMPLMDGHELCRQVKAAEITRDIPFMLLTALSEPSDIFKGLESGADFYKLKPFDAMRLIDRVQSILDESRARYRTSEAGVAVHYAGQKYFINAGRSQILDLLLATFENILRQNNELQETNRKLSEALEANKLMRGLIPIYGYCKKVRDDKGYWNQVESFVAQHSAAQFSHGICPQCYEKQIKALGLDKEARVLATT